MALAVPLAGSIARKGRSAQCMHSLRQLSTATFTYMGDHNMAFPIAYLADRSKTIIHTWYLPLSAEQAPYQLGNYPQAYIQHAGYGIKKPPFFCMENPTFLNSGEKAWTNYAMNNTLVGKNALQLNGVKVLFIDSLYSATKQYWYLAYGPSYSEWKNYLPSHGQHSHFAFTDGHIEVIPISPTDPARNVPKAWFDASLANP